MTTIRTRAFALLAVAALCVAQLGIASTANAAIGTPPAIKKSASDTTTTLHAQPALDSGQFAIFTATAPPLIDVPILPDAIDVTTKTTKTTTTTAPGTIASPATVTNKIGISTTTFNRATTSPPQAFTGDLGFSATSTTGIHDPPASIAAAF